MSNIPQKHTALRYCLHLGTYDTMHAVEVH